MSLKNRLIVGYSETAVAAASLLSCLANCYVEAFLLKWPILVNKAVSTYDHRYVIFFKVIK